MIGSYCSCNKFSSLKQHKFVILEFWRSESGMGFPGLTLRSPQSFTVKALGKNPFPGLFQSLTWPAICGTWPYSICRACCVAASPSLTMNFLPPSVTCKNPYNYIEPNKKIQNLPTARSLPWSHLQSPFSHVKLHFPRLQRLQRGHRCGGEGSCVILPSTDYLSNECVWSNFCV